MKKKQFEIDCFSQSLWFLSLIHNYSAWNWPLKSSFPWIDDQFRWLWRLISSKNPQEEEKVYQMTLAFAKFFCQQKSHKLFVKRYSNKVDQQELKWCEREITAAAALKLHFGNDLLPAISVALVPGIRVHFAYAIFLSKWMVYIQYTRSFIHFFYALYQIIVTSFALKSLFKVD